MALVILQHSFHDGERLHPAGMYVQVPDAALVKILKGEDAEPKGFMDSIKKKRGRPAKEAV